MKLHVANFGRSTILLALCLGSVAALSQEVRFIDMTAEKPRTELRHLPSPPPKCESNGPCVGGGYGGGSVADGAPDRRDPRALALYIVSIQPTDIDTKQPVVAEFRLLNSGLANIRIPISPNLSDLQPAEESQNFDYESIDLAAAERASSRVGCVGQLQLFGSPQHDGTLLELKPGEWIRIRGKLNWLFPPSETHDATLTPAFTLRGNTYTPHPGGGSFTAMRNIYPNVTPIPGIAVRFVVAETKH